MQVWNVLHAARWKYRKQKIAKNSPSGHHRTTLSTVGLYFATKACIDNRKKNVKLQYILHISHNMVNFGPLAAEIGFPNWGTPANFNGFRLLASLLHRRHSLEANQTLHDVWPSPGLVHCIYIFRGSCHLREFCQVQNSLCVEVLPCPILALEQWTWAKLCCVVQGKELRNFRRGRHQYSAGRPSRWASAYILIARVNNVLCTFCKQKMIVLADSEVSDVKLTWRFWNKWRRIWTYVQTSALEVEGMLERLHLRLWVTAI